MPCKVVWTQREGKVERKEEAKEGGEKERERGSCNRTTFVLLEGRRRKGGFVGGRERGEMGVFWLTLFFSLFPGFYHVRTVLLGCRQGKKGKGNLVQFGPLGRCVQWLGIAEGEGP